MNETKVPLKKHGLETGYKKRFTEGVGVQNLRASLEIFKKKGGLGKKEVEKTQEREGVATLPNMNVYVSTLHVYLT